VSAVDVGWSCEPGFLGSLPWSVYVSRQPHRNALVAVVLALQPAWSHDLCEALIDEVSDPQAPPRVREPGEVRFFNSRQAALTGARSSVHLL
jgi:hypothetical protein